MAKQLTNVGDAVLDHGGTLQTQTPAKDAHVLGKTHGLEHLRAEHATVANLDQFVQALVVAEDFHAGLGVGVVGALELEIGDTHLAKEDFHELHQTAERQAVVGNDTLDLVELCQMRSVDRLVAEHTVDGEVARGRRAAVGSLFRGELLQQRGGNGCGVCSQDEALGLFR